MDLTSEEIARLRGAFAAFWQVERQGQGDDKAWTYLFDVLTRTPAEQAAEMARWLDTQGREIARRLPDVAARVQAERDTAEEQLAALTTLRVRIVPPPTP